MASEKEKNAIIWKTNWTLLSLPKWTQMKRLPRSFMLVMNHDIGLQGGPKK